MKVVLADDHTIVRQGLRSLLETKLGIEVMGEASDGREALALTEKLQPDLIILDIAMPGLNGLEALQQIQVYYPQVKVIILSMHVEENYVSRALRLGASGFVYKGSAFDDLELAMRAVLKGEVFLSSAVSQVLVNGFLQISTQKQQDQILLERLSPREREILQLFSEGKTRTQIAELLSISVKTVDRHKENLKDKLETKKDKELRLLAGRFGLTG